MLVDIWLVGGVVSVIFWFFVSINEEAIKDDENWITILIFAILFLQSWIGVVIGLMSLYRVHQNK